MVHGRDLRDAARGIKLVLRKEFAVEKPILSCAILLFCGHQLQGPVTILSLILEGHGNFALTPFACENFVKF